jgi:hypothetical protein
MTEYQKLRAQLAGMAMQGRVQDPDSGLSMQPKEYAKEGCIYADALLKELGIEEEEENNTAPTRKETDLIRDILNRPELHPIFRYFLKERKMPEGGEMMYSLRFDYLYGFVVSEREWILSYPEYTMTAHFGTTDRAEAEEVAAALNSWMEGNK